MNRLPLILAWMNRLLLILVWMTAGAWATATIRVALSPDSDLTPIALTITLAFIAIAHKITRDYEKEKNDAVR